MDKKIEQRYKSAKEFADDIDRFLCGKLIKAKPYSFLEKSWNKVNQNKWSIFIVIVVILAVVASIWSFEKHNTAKTGSFLAKANKWQQQANKAQTVNREMELYIKISNMLEKALATSPNNFAIKNQLISTLEKMGLLAKEQKNYLLGFALFQQCKRLGYKKADILLNQLEQEKILLRKKHRQFIAKIMKKITKKTQQTLVNRYVFDIVKIGKSYIVEILVPYLKKTNKRQRFFAIRVLGKLGNKYTKIKGKDSVQWLVELLRRFDNEKDIDKNEEEIIELIVALGWLKDKRADRLVYKIRRLKQNGLVWEKTKIPYKWIPLAEEIIVKNAQNFFLRANRKMDKKNYFGAIEDYKNAIAAAPKNWEAHNCIGNAYWKLKKFTKAMAHYNKVISLNSKFSKVYNGKGHVYLRLAKYDKAIASYCKALSLNPQDPVAYNGRGLAYEEIQEYSKAIADYTQAAFLNPEMAGFYSNRGNVHRKTKEYFKAIEDYSKAISINSQFSLAYNGRGIAYKMIKKYSQAIEDYSKAIFLNPKDISAYINRGKIYWEKKDYLRVISDYSQVLILNSRHEKAYYGRGVAYWKLKKYNKALIDLTKTISINPKNSEAYNAIGNVYWNRKKYNKAIENYSKAISFNPKNWLAYSGRGKVHWKLKKHKKGVADYSQVIFLKPRYAPAYFNRANAYYHLKQHQKAAWDYKNFLKLNPNHPQARQIRAMIKRLLRKAKKKRQRAQRN